MTFDEQNEAVEGFLEEFKALVRKYVPKYDKDGIDLLYRLQEKTSVFNPYIWNDEE